MKNSRPKEAKIVVESLGTQDFFTVRDQLLKQGERFTEQTLALVNYSQLPYCALGVAEAAVCSLRLVREEKQRRRARFLELDPEEFQQCTGYLKLHGMYDDVVRQTTLQKAPRWHDLSYRVRAWAKLTCLSNHADFPLARLYEVIDLLQKATKEKNPLPEVVANNYIQRIKVLMVKFRPTERLDPHFREQLGHFTEDLTLSFSESDRQIIEKELIQDFSCTSDCFRMI